MSSGVRGLQKAMVAARTVRKRSSSAAVAREFGGEVCRLRQHGALQWGFDASGAWMLHKAGIVALNFALGMLWYWLGDGSETGRCLTVNPSGEKDNGREELGTREIIGGQARLRGGDAVFSV